jgi:hypothetical protein
VPASMAQVDMVLTGVPGADASGRWLGMAKTKLETLHVVLFLFLRKGWRLRSLQAVSLEYGLASASLLYESCQKRCIRSSLGHGNVVSCVSKCSCKHGPQLSLSLRPALVVKTFFFLSFCVCLPGETIKVFLLRVGSTY